MTLLKELKNSGVKNTVRKYARKFIGYSEIEEEIQTLHYFLDYYKDISKFPPAQGDLRKLQQCDKMLLLIFHNFCEKEGLRYWLDWGSLLGAVRHQGFIPWDDDLDISMPREDWNRVVDLFPEELKAQGIQLHEMEGEPLLRLGMGYNHYQTGIWMDIYPVEEVRYDDEQTLHTKVFAYKKWYAKHRKKCSMEEIKKKKAKFLNIQSDAKSIFVTNLETFTPYDKVVYFQKDDIFPLQKAEFEGYDFYVPNRSEKLLAIEYGENYNSFPLRGVEHHGNDSGKLASWARISNVDMDCVYEKMGQLL